VQRLKRGVALSIRKSAAHPEPRRETAAPNLLKETSRVPRSPGTGEEARFSRLIYERVRLGIMSALATKERLTFNELKSLCDVSDGNLGAHARKLEDAGYVICTKSFEGRRPKSEYRITPAGRDALLRYLEHIEEVIKATRRI
jgi:DNA-binding transcriptional ArsR family regulator